MNESTYGERVKKHKERLSTATTAAIIELARTIPGGQCDAPFAPIDPALNAAARELVREMGIDLSSYDHIYGGEL